MQLGPPWKKQASEESSVCGTACGSWKRKGARSPLCFVRLKARWLNESAMQLDYVRSEIERMRTQVHRQRGELGCASAQFPTGHNQAARSEEHSLNSSHQIISYAVFCFQ